MENEVNFRFVERGDLSEVFLLLQQLSKIDYSGRNKDICWAQFISNNSSNSIVGLYKKRIVAYGSVVIENKIRGELSGHIEDIVIDKCIRNKKIGVKLINELLKIAEDNKCYRVTLLCNDDLKKFYNKTGFIDTGIAMKKFITYEL